MLPQSDTQATSPAAPNSVQQHWPTNDIDQPESVAVKVQQNGHALSDTSEDTIPSNPADSAPKWASRPVTGSSYADTLSSSALHSSQSKEVWRSIAFEALNKSTKGPSESELPVTAPAGAEKADSGRRHFSAKLR